MEKGHPTFGKSPRLQLQYKYRDLPSCSPFKRSWFFQSYLAFFVAQILHCTSWFLWSPVPLLPQLPPQGPPLGCCERCAKKNAAPLATPVKGIQKSSMSSCKTLWQAQRRQEPEHWHPRSRAPATALEAGSFWQSLVKKQPFVLRCQVFHSSLYGSFVSISTKMNQTSWFFRARGLLWLAGGQNFRACFMPDGLAIVHAVLDVFTSHSRLFTFQFLRQTRVSWDMRRKWMGPCVSCNCTRRGLRLTA